MGIEAFRLDPWQTIVTVVVPDDGKARQMHWHEQYIERKATYKGSTRRPVYRTLRTLTADDQVIHLCTSRNPDTATGLRHPLRIVRLGHPQDLLSRQPARQPRVRTPRRLTRTNGTCQPATPSDTARRA